MLRREHVQLIATHYVKHSLRGGAGLVFIFLGLVVGLICAQAVIGSIEMAQKSGLGAQELVRAGDELLRKFSSLPSEQIGYLTQTKPAVISAFIVVLFFVTPAMAILGAFNQTSGDIGSKGLRYLVQRTERTNLFIGRLIGAYLQTLVVFLLLFVIVTLYVMAKIKIYPAGDMILWMAGGYVRLALLVLPYTALCAWISASFEVPFGALTVALLVIFFIPAVAWVAGKSNPAIGDAINYLHPGGYKWWLLHPELGYGAGATGALLGFTALFTWLGWRHFEGRDL